MADRDGLTPAEKAALDAAHDYDVAAEWDGFHLTCPLSEAVLKALDAYQRAGDDDGR